MTPEIKRMMEKIRDAVSGCKGNERVVLEALVEESEGWAMRLSELEAEDEDDDA